MKKLLAVLPMILIAVTISSNAQAAFEPEVDYLEIMVRAAVVGDYATGYAAQEQRDEKIGTMGLSYIPIKFDELMLLSKIMYAEAGSVWLNDEWKMCVGEVVLNRVASPEFPNTIAAVLAQPGQYYGANSRYFNSLLPSETCVRLAIRLLEGERLMDPAVVFQANFKQGSGTHTARYDKYLGWTYFCFSSKPELYAVTEVVAEVTEEISEPAEGEVTEEVPEETPEEVPEEVPVEETPEILTESTAASEEETPLT